MSEFLIIAPDSAEWIQMSSDEVNRLVTTVVSAQDIITYITSNDLFNLTLLMRDYNFLTIEQELSSARIIPTNNADYPYQFWYKLTTV